MTEEHPRVDDRWLALSDRLRSLAVGLAGSEADADDLVQQTFANLLARRPEKSLDLAYARRALVHTWMDQQRSVRRRLARMATKARTQRLWHVDSDAASDEEVQQRIRDIVSALPARQRAVLTMRTVEGMNGRSHRRSTGLLTRRREIESAPGAARRALATVGRVVMISDRTLEDFHDERLPDDEMKRLADALRQDPHLRSRLSAIRRTDDLVCEALRAPGTPRRTSPVVPIAAAAAVALAGAGVWRAMTATPPDTSSAPIVSNDRPEYESVRVVFTLAGAAPRKTPPTEVPVEEDAAPATPIPGEISKRAVHTTLASLTIDEQFAACRAWAADGRVRPFVFEYLRELGRREGLTDDVAILGAELQESPELKSWVRSYLPAMPARPSSSADTKTPTRA